MNKLITCCLILVAVIQGFAQNSNAVLFTENGERFQVVLNGVIQNITPATNVKQIPWTFLKLVAPVGNSLSLRGGNYGCCRWEPH